MPAKPTTASEPEVDTAMILYNREPQTIPLKITGGGGRVFRVTHSLAALSNDRYFELMKQLEESNDRMMKAGKVTTLIYAPKEKLWDELAGAVEGYKQREDWKSGVHTSHKSEAVTALINVQVVDNDEALAADELWDIDELTIVRFHAMQSGTLLLDLSHSFRPETKAEMDQFLAIDAGENPDSLASHNHKSRAERLYDLGKKMLVETTGYESDTDIPPWHLAATTESFFARRIAQAQR